MVNRWVVEDQRIHEPDTAQLPLEVYSEVRRHPRIDSKIDQRPSGIDRFDGKAQL